MRNLLVTPEDKYRLDSTDRKTTEILREAPGWDRRRSCATVVIYSPQQTGADELIVVSHIYDHAARVRSYVIVAEATKEGLGGVAELAASERQTT